MAQKSGGVNELCRLFGISKKAYYTSTDPGERLEKKYGDLKGKITRIIHDNPGYGYPRIKRALEKTYGIVVNHKVLLKLLRLWGLELRRTIRRPKKNFVITILNFLQKRANVLFQLIRENKITGCSQVIVSDVTEIRFSGKKAYLSVHMDFFGKMVYGYCLSLSADVSGVLSSLSSAVKTLKRLGCAVKKIVLHQDRGSVYTSSEYVSEALAHEFRLSYSRKGEPGDNAVNEAFFSRLKSEWADVFADAKDFNELHQMIDKAIEYYNTKRYHSSLDYHTPLEFFNKFSSGCLTQKNGLTAVS